MCIVLKPDIIIASEISEFCARFQMKKQELIQQQVEKLSACTISINSCMHRQEASKEIGLCNVIAEATVEDYRDFLDTDGLFVWVGPDEYQLREDVVSKLFGTTATFAQQLTKLFNYIIKISYSQKTKRYLNVL